MALVRQWKLDETSGTTAADSSGNGDSGTYVGSPSLNQTGPGGSWTAAVAFTIGSGQHVSSLDGSSSIWSGSVASITGRFQCDDPSRTAAEQVIGEWGIASTGPCVYLYGDTLYAGFAVSGTFHYVSTAVSDTGWHSFVAVFNGTAMTLFLDGSSAATGTAGASFATASSTGAIAAGATTRTHLGANFGTGALPFGGKLCDIRCYDDAKDASFASTYHAEQSAAGLTLDASPATITATPQSAGLTISRTLTASPASITVTPQSAGLTIIGAAVSLDTNRVFNFKLEETSGDVCRNQIRTLRVANPTLTGTGGASEYGTAPDGWQELGAGAGEGSATITSEATGTSWIGSIINGGGGSAQTLLRQDGVLTIGEVHVLVVEWRLLSEVVGTPTLRAWTGGSTVELAALESFTVADGWQTTTTLMLAATNDEVNVIVLADSLNEYAHIEVRSAYVYAENAGTATSDLSTLTTAGRVGRAVNLDGTDYISAPWDGGFTYPTTLACAFKLDTLTDSAARTLLSLTDASASNVNWKIRVNAAGTAIETVRQNTTEYATSVASAASLLWRTVAVVFHDATSFTLYLDGEPLSTQTGLDSVSASAAVDTLLVGLARLTSPTEYADGITVDEVSAWTRELSAADVAEWHQFTIFPLAARHSAEPLGLETSLSL